MKKMFTYFKRKIILFFGKTKYKDFSNKSLTKNEKICKSICLKMIKHKSSKFLLSPISKKRYIKNDELEMFIVLNDKQVKITNSKYHYDVLLTEREWDRIVFFYDNKTEKIREELEEHMFCKINNSLNEILKQIKDGSI